MAYLHARRLVRAQAGFRPATVRHILTHTAGIPESVYAADLLHPSWGPFDSRPAVHSVQGGEPLPSRAEDYRDGPRMVVEPVSAFAYTDSGFATLGQIVKDVSGTPFERSLRERIIDPLGMADSDHARSERIASRLSTGGDPLTPIEGGELRLSALPPTGLDLAPGVRAAGPVRLTVIDQSTGLSEIPGVTLPARPETVMSSPGLPQRRGYPTAVRATVEVGAVREAQARGS